MNLDVDFLINFMKKYTKTKGGEINEDDAPAPAPSAAPAGGSSAPAGRAVKKWESGITKGKANQTANTVWTSGRKDGPTYWFDRKKQWSTGRQLGKTGGSDFA